MAGGIKGLDKLMKKYDQMAEIAASDTMARAVNASCKMVQGEARLLCPVDTGELRQSIRTSVETSNGVTIGTIYTNKEYAPYVEFGTGPKGEKNHEGISPYVTPAYSQTGWFRPGEEGEKAVYTEGQAAQPFMYPALKNNEERATRNISN